MLRKFLKIIGFYISNMIVLNSTIPLADGSLHIVNVKSQILESIHAWKGHLKVHKWTSSFTKSQKENTMC